ncbi:MAG: Na/Pi cotransporter family protein [Syntrophaceticus schinkii]|nr:Na/Pi cotransporter family protein [Syntrophaceticus schinkii]MDD4675009.1 Na/Pi cotransporter family protein [Syntrophaceticus schinkii]
MLNVIFGVLGGLALFLFGMKIMGEGLQKVAGDKIRKILERVTRYPVVAVLLGAVTTAAIQSSSATTVLVVGFVNAGLMTLKQAIGVIMGANIGTTITAQLIAFKLTDYVFLIIAIGFCINFFSKRRVYHYVGQFILGIGILFLGLDVMSNAVVPLRGSPVFLDFIASFSRYPLLGVLVGIIITCVVQSSAATIGMLIALASQDIITFNAAIPVLFGDNIGTCITALLASIGTNLNARRAAVAHVMFNVTGTLIFLILLPWFREFVYFISPSEPARLIANAHTSFNILNTCLFLPFVGAFTKLIEKLLPGTVEIEEKGPIYLDERMFDTPAVALSLATKEIIRMGNIASRSLESAMQGFYEKNERFLEATKEDEEIIDELEREITFYLAKLSQKGFSQTLSGRHTGLLHAVKDIERVGDHAENIAELAWVRIEENLPYSEFAIKELEEMYTLVSEVYKNALGALQEESKVKARLAVQVELFIDQKEKELRNSHLKRLNKGICYPTSGVIFLDIISNLERIGDHANNVAEVVLEHF